MNNIREEKLSYSIAEYKKVTKKLAKLLIEKEQLTEDIISCLGHDHEGQRTYTYDTYNIECKTPFTYSLDKKAYVSGDVYLPSEFDPIKESTTYTVDKKLCEQFLQTSPASVRDALEQLITKKAGKPSINIKDAI